MLNANSGYSGYSMSNRAAEAYSNGEKPLSKWTKSELISAISKIDPNKAESLKKLKLAVLRESVLTYSSWHHTSDRFNETKFYSVDEEYINRLTDKDITALASKKYAKKDAKEDVKKYKGSIYYLEWTGTRKHPKATEKCLEHVNIEERGAFYYISDDSGKELLKKKVGSNGTRVVNYKEEEEKKKAAAERERIGREHSSKAALEFYDEIKDDCTYSGSNHIYRKGRKPTHLDYEAGLDKYFEKGEKRLYEEYASKILHLEIWNGTEWIKEDKDGKCEKIRAR